MTQITLSMTSQQPGSLPLQGVDHGRKFPFSGFPVWREDNGFEEKHPSQMCIAPTVIKPDLTGTLRLQFL